MRRGGAADVKADFTLHLEQKISVEVIIIFKQYRVNVIDKLEELSRKRLRDLQPGAAGLPFVPQKRIDDAIGVVV